MERTAIEQAVEQLETFQLSEQIPLYAEPTNSVDPEQPKKIL